MSCAPSKDEMVTRGREATRARISNRGRPRPPPPRSRCRQFPCCPDRNEHPSLPPRRIARRFDPDVVPAAPPRGGFGGVTASRAIAIASRPPREQPGRDIWNRLAPQEIARQRPPARTAPPDLV